MVEAGRHNMLYRGGWHRRKMRGGAWLEGRVLKRGSASRTRQSAGARQRTPDAAECTNDA